MLPMSDAPPVGPMQRLQPCRGRGRKRGPSPPAPRPMQNAARAHIRVDGEMNVEVLAGRKIGADPVMRAATWFAPHDQGQGLPWSLQADPNRRDAFRREGG